MPCCRVLPGAPSYTPTAVRLYPTRRPRMKRILIVAVVGLVLAAGGALLHWTVFLDIEQFRDDLGVKAATGAPAHYLAERARRTHRGEGPCLRYIGTEAISDEEI